MVKPLVSVVLPTHNRLHVLPRAVHSVLGQTYTDLELIVVDDGSNDGTAEWLASLSDTRLRHLKLEERRGAAAARNAGVRAARGQLVAFQDSDDEWLPSKLELQVAALMSAPQGVDWIGGSYLVWGEGRPRYVRSSRLEHGQDYATDLLEGQPFVTPTWLVRRERLHEVGLFDESMPCLEDWDLIFRLDLRCRFWAVPQMVLVRHGSTDSVFGDLQKRRVGLTVMLARHSDRWEAHPAWAAHYWAELARLHSLCGDDMTALACFLRSLRLQPLRLRTVSQMCFAGLRALRRTRTV